MKPSELSATLRRIATMIDNSKNPSKTKVAQALKQILVATSETTSAPAAIRLPTPEEDKEWDDYHKDQKDKSEKENFSEWKKRKGKK